MGNEPRLRVWDNGGGRAIGMREVGRTGWSGVIHSGGKNVAPKAVSEIHRLANSNVSFAMDPRSGFDFVLDAPVSESGPESFSKFTFGGDV